ncbi:MAG TPA: alpha-L-rhamnosidase C-terminal domain-containing protein [Azospirillaceae bacterium]|nr:alpha-L-rhamnosidase C-terminal domain-containing protein [Azospirillaceae bacterium]
MLRAAEFIWLPDQPADHQALVRLLRGPVQRRTTEGENRWVLFRRGFDLPADADPAGGPADLAITADGRYRLWVNGTAVGRGPVRSTPHHQRVDRHDVAALLRPGRNVIAVLVHTPGVDLAWYECVKGAWQPVLGDGGLYVHLRAGRGDAAVEVVSDAAWRVVESPAWRRDTPRAGWGQDFIEDVDGRALDPAWTEADYDDGAWPHAREMVSTGTAADIAKGWGVVRAFPALLPREIPPLTETPVAPAAVAWACRVVPRPDLPVERRLYQETLAGPADDLVENAAGLLRPDGGPAVFRTTAGHDVALMLRFDPYHSGHPFIDIEAEGGEIVEVAVAEAVPGEFGAAAGPEGLRLDGPLACAHLFRYTARPGRQRFEKFEWSAVRALQIVVRNAPNGLRLHRVGSVATCYPARPEGAFACSDPALTRLWEVGRHTALQCMHDAWEDCPGRERRQWVGDAVVGFDIAAAAFGPSVFPLARQFLRQVAESQRPDGLTPMFTPGDHHGEGLIIPDYTLHWILGIGRYLQASGDEELAEALFPAVQRALDWFARHAGPDGRLVDVPFWHFIEWAHLERTGAATAVNALHAGALAAAATLARRIGYARAADRYAAAADHARAALNAEHWDEARGVYADAVDPRTGRRGERVSQQANALMILLDLAPRERWERMAAAMTEDAHLKVTAAPPIVPVGEPMDPAVDMVRANTYYCHFLYEALAAAGRFDWVLGDMRRFYGRMLAAGATTLWESFEPTASLCHVFSATPVYQLSRQVLGVAPLDPAFRRFGVTPRPGDLDWASGRVPTPAGPIRVDWRREGDTVHLSVEHPDGTVLDDAAVPGFKAVTVERSAGRLRAEFRRDAPSGGLGEARP